jgi:hypothetical protein
VEITPPSNFSGDFDLTATATTTDDSGDTASVDSTFTVTVEGVADDAALTAGDVSGFEDSPIALDLSASVTDTDGSETVSSVTVSGVPEGASLSAGVDNGDGSWTLSVDEIDGVEITPPSNFSGEFDLTATATTTDDSGDTASVDSTFTVSVEGVADDAKLEISDAAGKEDGRIGLDVSAALSDLDGSETLSITVSGVPDGASLSAGIDNGDGTWSLAPEQLEGLSVLPPEHFSGSFELEVTATAAEADGDTAETAATLTVEVAGVADGVSISGGDLTAFTGEAAPLGIDATLIDADGSESVTFTVRGLPEGVGLSAGTENPDGTWTLTPEQLDGVTLDTAGGYAGSFELTITATSTEADGDTSTTARTMKVDVTPPTDGSVAGTPDGDASDPVPQAPAEIEWGADVELGVIDTVSEIDQTLEDIDEQITELEPPARDADAPDESLPYRPVIEVSPFEGAESGSDAPVPPPSDPLFEFTREDGATRSEEVAESGVETSRAAADPQAIHEAEDTSKTVRQQFTESFALLWSLIRSVGARPTNDDRQSGSEQKR